MSLWDLKIIGKLMNRSCLLIGTTGSKCSRMLQVTIVRYWGFGDCLFSFSFSLVGDVMCRLTIVFTCLHFIVVRRL